MAVPPQIFDSTRALSKSTGVNNTDKVPLDWIVIAVPVVLAIRPFSPKASLALLAILIAAAAVRRCPFRRSLRMGPLLALWIAAGIALVRSEPRSNLIILVLVSALTVVLVRTVDARIVIGSLIDGIGICLLLNVLSYSVGLRSPNADSRIAGYIETTGMVRIIWPLGSSLDEVAALASIYIAAGLYLIVERDWPRRLFRSLLLCAALYILYKSGARTGIAPVILVGIVFAFPGLSGRLAQLTTICASISAIILPPVVTRLESVITAIFNFIAPGRTITAQQISSLNFRSTIWERSIDYWQAWVYGSSESLIGFGQGSQYLSGVSQTYASELANIVRNPEYASLHNSFLQQLFDGGLIGVLLLTLAIYWAASRLSAHADDWARNGIVALLALIALLLNGMTQVSIAPGAGQQTFWILVILVGVACQSQGSSTSERQSRLGAQNPEWINTKRISSISVQD